MSMLLKEGFIIASAGTYSVPDDLLDLLVDELDHSGCNDREKDLRGRYARDREEYERRRRDKALEAAARECGVEREPEPDGFIDDLERVADPKIAPVEEEIVALSPLAVAVRSYLERRPDHAHQSAYWIGATLWVEGLHPKLDDSSAQTRAAIEELGGAAFLRDLKAVAA